MTRSWGGGGHRSDLRTAGGILLAAGSVILMAIITAEALYPAPYTTGGNEISDLGGARPPEALVFQPSATIFNVAMIVVGLAVIAAAVLAHRGLGRWVLTVPLGLLGIGALGVGLFPGTTGTPHALAAMVTFVAGGLACVAGGVVTAGPFRWLSVALGSISLLTLASYMTLGDGAPLAGLGVGGVERWVVYPIVLWIVGFGGYLSARAGVA